LGYLVVLKARYGNGPYSLAGELSTSVGNQRWPNFLNTLFRSEMGVS